jgi:hypothetical protein
MARRYSSLRLLPARGRLCERSGGHYRPAPNARGAPGVPWTASTNSAFRGYLFYFGGTPWARAQPRRARIFTTGAHLRVSPKVLWVALRKAGPTLAIHGRRLDGTGSFAAVYPAAIGGGQFPSYVEVPGAGCWRVTVSSGSLRGSVTFFASDTVTP